MDYKETIEMYLNGELKGEALKSFLDRLDNDAFYMKEFTIRKEIEDALTETDVIDLKNNLEKIHLSFGDTKSRKISKFEFNTSSFRWLLVAATLTLALVSSAILFYINNESYSSGELYSMYYKPYDSYGSVRSGKINTDDIFINAQIKYDKNDFENALTLFQQVLDVDKTNIASYFYAGVCYIETQKFEKASESFQFIINHNDNLFVEQAEWYLALSYLNSNQKEIAKKHFEAIANSQSYYKEKATEILDQL